MELSEIDWWKRKELCDYNLKLLKAKMFIYLNSQGLIKAGLSRAQPRHTELPFNHR